MDEFPLLPPSVDAETALDEIARRGAKGAVFATGDGFAFVDWRELLHLAKSGEPAPLSSAPSHEVNIARHMSPGLVTLDSAVLSALPGIRSEIGASPCKNKPTKACRCDRPSECIY